jgi:hypothetical protein
MDGPILTTTIITVQQLLELRNHKTHPIDGLNIPNITVPPHLVSKKRATEAGDTIAINIRQLFNCLTPDNVAIIREQLRNIIVTKAQTVQMIEEIAQEILSNFIVMEEKIKNCMHLLNSVSAACVLIPEPVPDKTGNIKNVSPTIGNIFLNKCREMIFKSIEESNVRTLAQMDLENIDQLDAYNREREKINNLIVTICYLYEQRNTPNIKLTALPIYSLVNTILNLYIKNNARMVELGNPYDGDCKDEDEYEVLRKICTIYAEQLYLFMSREAKDFCRDPDVFKGKSLKNLVDIFRNNVVPTLTEAYLISKCESIAYK